MERWSKTLPKMLKLLPPTRKIAKVDDISVDDYLSLIFEMRADSSGLKYNVKYDTGEEVLSKIKDEHFAFCHIADLTGNVEDIQKFTLFTSEFTGGDLFSISLNRFATGAWSKEMTDEIYQSGNEYEAERIAQLKAELSVLSEIRYVAIYQPILHQKAKIVNNSGFESGLDYGNIVVYDIKKDKIVSRGRVFAQNSDHVETYETLSGGLETNLKYNLDSAVKLFLKRK